MAFSLNRTESPISREERIKINENWTRIESGYNGIVDVVATQAFEKVVDSAKLDWLAPVDTFANLATTYPNAVEGNAAMAKDTGIIYRFDGTQWEPIQQIDATAINEVDSRLGGEITVNKESLNQRGINIMYPPAPLVGAKGDYNPDTGLGTDDTAAIQACIDYANSIGVRKVFAPSKDFLISSTIFLNGCTLIGVKSNIYSESSKGSCFITSSKDFIAISQGSMATNDIQFGISDIYVKNALVGFEINYAINSKFERLYAVDCDTGYKLGDLSAVGSMFCEFNNLYTTGTRIGAIVQSKNYFNNNRFNNGFIYGSEKAFHLEVTGGYGAVNNVFNNVEFRSPLGRGIILTNTRNTIFNSVYFECGGNAIRTINFSSIILNDCVYGVFKADNFNLDTSVVFAEGGLRMNLDGGLIFLTPEYDNKSFYDTANSLTYSNIYITNNISTNGTASNFQQFKQITNEIAYKKEKQALTTSTLNIDPNTTATLDFTFPTPFSKTPDGYSIVPRGSSGQENDVQWLLVSISATGGKISVRNNSSGTKSINFRVTAEII